MAFSGSGLFTMWNDVEPQKKFDFNFMHSRNHLLDHLAYLGENGILEGRRYVDGNGTLPPFFMLYDMRSLSILVDDEHQHCRVADSPWFLSLRPSIRDLIRYNWNVVCRAGGGCGSAAATFLIEAPKGTSDRLTIWKPFLSHLLTSTACTAAHVGSIDLTTPIRVSQPVPEYTDADISRELLVVESFDRHLLARTVDQIDAELQSVGLADARTRYSHYSLSFQLEFGDLPTVTRLEALPNTLSLG
ncbi:hypothetical protein HNQ96_004980 [Aminobacter lissarensis]|uniref:Uncharacterized protein n=1 Tax=Aminobacter carboxidus TaxID=376165 RepID=A0A8E1WKM7_9HYPH|nr:hypothetical protein [Aminobacter lissarensis]MBB6469091.1 hypothetical protein [Aminobacter lissarensis]